MKAVKFEWYSWITLLTDYDYLNKYLNRVLIFHSSAVHTTASIILRDSMVGGGTNKTGTGPATAA